MRKRDARWYLRIVASLVLELVGVSVGMRHDVTEYLGTVTVVGDALCPRLEPQEVTWRVESLDQPIYLSRKLQTICSRGMMR